MCMRVNSTLPPCPGQGRWMRIPTTVSAKAAQGLFLTGNFIPDPRSVAISVEPIFSDAWSFSIRETEDGAAFDCRTGLMGWSRKGRGEIDKEEWQAFTASLFDDIYISSWKPMYFSPAEIKGMVWDIGIKLHHKHSLSFHGIGTVPPYWNELISLIDPFFRDIGLSVWSKDEKQA